jgi:hypothetical protein
MGENVTPKMVDDARRAHDKAYYEAEMKVSQARDKLTDAAMKVLKDSESYSPPARAEIIESLSSIVK